MSATSPLGVARRGAALVVTLARPQRDNRFDTDTLQRLATQVSAIARDETVRAVVLTGEGDVFCCGGDVAKDTDGRRAFGEAFLQAMKALNQCTVPVLAAVNGRCSAGGMALLEAADYAVCTEGATFGYPEIAAGAFPLLALVTVPAHMPKKLFFDLAYTGKLIDAPRALELLLVNELVPQDGLWESVDRFVAALADKRAAALSRGRELYYACISPLREPALAAAAAALVDAAPLNADRTP